MKNFTVTITDPTRAAEWRSILGTSTLHVQSPIPTKANLPGKPNALVYFLDQESLTHDQLDALIDHLAAKFNIPPAEVRCDAMHNGIPILAEHCVSIIADPLKWFD